MAIRLGSTEFPMLHYGLSNIKKGLIGTDLVFVPKIPTRMPVVLYDRQRNRNVITSELSDADPERFVPIGICVIPSEHDVYGTGECGVMALRSASISTPDTGQNTNPGLYYGGYNTDYSSLVNFNVVARCGTINNSTPYTYVNGTSGIGYLPIQRSGANVKVQCPTDSKAWYFNTSSTTSGYLPSPYTSTGGRNSEYYSTTSPSTQYNALSDFNGKSNSEFLWSQATAQSDWKTATTITANGGAGYHPAACACWRYHTEGTEQGDWYMPALGEIGYMVPRYDDINATIRTLQNWTGETYGLLEATNFQTSTEYSATNARSFSFDNGVVGSCAKNAGRCVRPYMRCEVVDFEDNDYNYFSGTKEAFSTLSVFINDESTGTSMNFNNPNFKYKTQETVTSCYQLFRNNPQNINTLDMSYWDMSSVTNMKTMFGYCKNLRGIKGISNWDVSSVTDMSSMFYECSQLTSIGNLSNWDVSSVTDMSSMFYLCSQLTSIGNLSNWDTSSVTNMEFMFIGCHRLTSLDLSNWDVSSVTTMQFMFDTCTYLTSLDLSNWDISSLKYKYCIFHGCSSLNHIKCSKAFRDWCWYYQDDINLPESMKEGGTGTWEIVD